MSMEKQEQGGPKNDDRGLGGYMSRSTSAPCQGHAERRRRKFKSSLKVDRSSLSLVNGIVLASGSISRTTPRFHILEIF